MRNWWWDMLYQLSTRVIIVLVIYVSDRTHLTNVSSDQHAWPLYLLVDNIQKVFHYISKKHARINIGLIPCPRNGAKYTEETWHSVIGTTLSPLRNIDMTGASLNWICADRLQRQCYPAWATWVGDDPEYRITSHVLYGAYLMS